MCRPKLGCGMPRLKTPFSHRSLSVETSGALHKYPGEVLPLTVEDNKPQDRYHCCERCTTVIQEDVITKDVHDYRPEQHQRQRYEPVHQQQHAAGDLEH